MLKKIITKALVAMLAVYAVANQERPESDFEKGGYMQEDGDYEDKSNERIATISGESGACEGTIDSRNSDEGYEQGGSYRKRNHQIGYSSAKASAAASADASAKTYERGHKDNIFI